MLKRVLIANRGEIAIRIARAAAGLGIESVSVHSPADALGLHTRTSDRTVEIGAGEPDPVKPYLDIEALIAAAVETGCDAVHPGYGFLSETAAFARRCLAEGLTFVGPMPETLDLFGDKVRARALAASLEIPTAAGSDGALASAEDAARAAERIGYPVMLKASGGGGGRGMRRVDRPSELETAFARCRSEAQAAFGDGAVFLEKIVARPRHIEVQVLADAAGGAIHLWERDCSVQLRHQKVIEIAPAAGLDPDLRARILEDALRLARAAEYVNAGTVEFLVEPETGAHVFIECNPRIQVEHTVTEQVTGVDLVEAQFRIASGETLAELGLSEPPQARGYAVQARVTAAGAGRLDAYKEPGGPGIRVDSCGYPGLAPPPQFDPMFAKVIATSNSTGSLASAVGRCRRALAEFHIAGLPTNLAQLQAILAVAAVREGDARTTLLAERPELAQAPAAQRDASPAVALMAEGAGPAAGRRAPLPPAEPPRLPLEDGEEGVESPMAGAVVEVAARVGATVAAGDTLVVVSAMKMETSVTAPVAGVVTRLAALEPGVQVAAGQMVAAIAPSAEARNAARPTRAHGDDGWRPTLDKVAALQKIAHDRFAPESQDPGVVRQRSRGKLACRERIELLLDPGSFREVGSLAGFASYDEAGAIAEFTPANHVGGWGAVQGRRAIVCADDFTSRGGHADGAIGQKSRYLDELSLEFRCPSVRLLDGSSGGGSVAAMVPKQQGEGESAARESTGAIQAGRPRVAGGGGSFLPGHLGSEMYARQLATVPVVNVLLGSVVGIGAAKAVLGHFSVMVRDIAQLFVAGPPVVAHAMGYEISKEDLGDWRIHCRNGSVDNLAETEEAAFEQARRFLSYLPSSVFEAPPRAQPDPADPPDRREEELFTLIPRKRTTTFDMRRAVRLMADRGSFFEIGALWGADQITGLARFNGHPVGVMASDSRHENGGALTADGCDKLKRLSDLCDLFHLPILNLVDNPGFAVGLEHEIAGTIRKGGEWMIAFSQVGVPIFTVIMRRSFGVAGNNYATPKAAASARVVWPAADVGGIPPEGGIEAAYKRQLAEAADPAALRAEIEARIESVRGPIGPLNRFQMEEMIDPRDTRRWICEWVENAARVAALPHALVSRPLGYRP
ncbi:MAG TPA: carboxyl transferase domain-containing protein [Phenylobacterium sp.]|uniref:acetyl-CoA carboxylase family protein n=1 Tax=Phenylobacterium sp. TaxID=1871053 RepID=UPI002C81E1D9|nr:carboxyl transferase domain-containing protein [Phenylobacterium sp.]HSV04039.1 carboxyl transferase domain-containing protein [Phenylobacterium sp.]